MAEEQWILHYNGEKYRLNEAEVTQLRGWSGKSELIEVNRGPKSSVFIALSPGVPFHILRQPKPGPPRVFSA